MKAISLDVILKSDLISNEESCELKAKVDSNSWLTTQEIVNLDLPAKNRVEALLQTEFLSDGQLRELACDFAEHTLYIFQIHSPEDKHLEKCVRAARLYALDSASLLPLQEAINGAIPSVWKYEGTEFISAFEAGIATTFLAYEDAADMARLVARHTQKAAHRNLWEHRKNWAEPMMGREIEAIWQLEKIIERLS